VGESRRALHVRTGERWAVDAVEAWLTRHGLAVVGCADPYEACAMLAKLAGKMPTPPMGAGATAGLPGTAQERWHAVPAVVCVGLDRLSGDEHELLTYVRRAWGQAPILIYGEPMVPLTVAPGGPTWWCCSRESLTAILARPPESLAVEAFGDLSGDRGVSESAARLRRHAAENHSA